MNYLPSFLLTFLVALVGSSVSTANAQCTITNQPPSPNTTNNSGTYDYVQSFTAPCSGNMQYFELTASEAGTLPGATMYVYDGNVPNGSPIYTQAYPNITVAGAGSPITINVTGTLPLVSGNQYSFRFEATTLNFYFTIGDTYTGGQAWQDGSSLATTDFYFEISIGAACVPTTITPDLATLPSISDECSVAAPTAPTATNSCGTVVIGVPDVTFPITTQGTTQVTWTYDDGEGNTTTQMQDVVVEDVSAPVPNLAVLPDLTNQCEATMILPPSATDNCTGTITGTTTTTFPITTPGNSTITWTFDDGNGNVSTQTQNVVNPTIDNTLTVNGTTLEANQLVAAYQWLDCDDAFAPISGESNQSYTPTATGNYAVEITVQGCIDTSACTLIDFTGIDELVNSGKELVKIVDLLGRETPFKPNTPLIFIYSDGTMERVMEVND